MTLFSREDILSFVAKRTLLTKEEVRAVYKATAELMEETVLMKRNFSVPYLVNFVWSKVKTYTAVHPNGEIVKLDIPNQYMVLKAKLPARWAGKRKQPI